MKINKEIQRYQESILFGLSLRQMVFALLAIGVAVGAYFGLKPLMPPFSSFGRSCVRLHRMVSQTIVTRAARSQTPPIMPCRKPAIWQKKLSTSCRKRNPNRSGKPGQNLFHNMSSLGTPCSLLRHRGNIHRKASHREISLCANRLLQSGRSRFLQ